MFPHASTLVVELLDLRCCPRHQGRPYQWVADSEPRPRHCRWLFAPARWRNRPRCAAAAAAHFNAPLAVGSQYKDAAVAFRALGGGKTPESAVLCCVYARTSTVRILCSALRAPPDRHHQSYDQEITFRTRRVEIGAVSNLSATVTMQGLWF